jgi:uncharacterized protein YbgA (DUF1722 family)
VLSIHIASLEYFPTYFLLIALKIITTFKTLAERIILKKGKEPMYMKKETELLWASEKYTIMAKGYAFYKEIQGKMSEADQNEDYEKIQQQISQYKEKPYDVKAIVNTLEHVWGYFKKSADDRDKHQFFTQLNELKSSNKVIIDEIPDKIMANLQYLLEKYPSGYLSRSSFIKK